MKAFALALVIACLAAAQKPGQPTGAVSGRVLAGHGGPPVRGAAVTAMQITARQAMKEQGLAWSGQDGRFIIEGLSPGRYSLVAAKPALGNYGVRAEVRAGETTRNIDIPMTARGVLAGQVLDADRLPVEGATVSLDGLNRTRGRAVAFTAAAPSTDDRGEFRAASLRPSSSYFLVLQPPSKPGVAGAYNLLHPPVFYPNAVNPAEAQPIRAEPGVKIETIDFETPSPADTAVVILARAGVPGEQPRSCVRCRFSLQVRHAETWLEVLAGQSDRQGRIEIRGIHPGSYRMSIIESSTGGLYAGYGEVVAEKGQTRSHEVTAWAANPIPVELTLVDPPEALRSETAAWAAAVVAEPLEPRYPGLRRMDVARIEGRRLTGRGRYPLPPGEWALRLYKGELPPNCYIEEVRWGGRPQRGPFVAVNSQGFSARIEVRVGFAVGTVSGKVSGWDEDGPLRPLIRVLAEPGDGYGLDTTLVVGPQGEFRSDDLPPGTYDLYAASAAVRELDFRDPAIQARYANYAKRITLAPGETVRVELEAIR